MPATVGQTSPIAGSSRRREAVSKKSAAAGRRLSATTAGVAIAPCRAVGSKTDLNVPLHRTRTGHGGHVEVPFETYLSRPTLTARPSSKFSVKEEGVVPPMPSDAIVKEEGLIPPMPSEARWSDATVKKEHKDEREAVEEQMASQWQQQEEQRELRRPPPALPPPPLPLPPET